MPRSCRLLLTIPHSLCQRPLWTGKGKCQCCHCWGRVLRDTKSWRGNENMETKGSLFPKSLYIFIFYKSTASIYVEVCVNVCACAWRGHVLPFLQTKWSTLSGTLLWVLSLFFHIHHISFLWQSRPHIIMDHHKPFSGSFFLYFYSKTPNFPTLTTALHCLK